VRVTFAWAVYSVGGFSESKLHKQMLLLGVLATHLYQCKISCKCICGVSAVECVAVEPKPVVHINGFMVCECRDNGGSAFAVPVRRMSVVFGPVLA
jgi:hypothetical protein